MDILVLGAGMMGRAIAFDLERYSNFNKVVIADSKEKMIQSSKNFLKNKNIDFIKLDVDDSDDVVELFKKNDVVISAIPYRYNYFLAKMAVDTHTHFLDLGGNNDIVEKERSLTNEARDNDVLIIPDCGLAPGMTSIVVKEIVDNYDNVDFVKIRVGGLPVDPQPPLNYQIVFSPYGLINEYVEDAIVLDHGEIIKKKSMNDIEEIEFPSPFGTMEAFLTSGGCSTLPYTYQDKIGYLDYKTIRYPGHCKRFNTMLDLGFADEEPIIVNEKRVIPRDIFAELLLKNLPMNKRDVVLCKVISDVEKNGEKYSIIYTMIDYYDDENDITSMMRTTGYPVSVIAQLIEQGIISDAGAFCGEEIVPCKPFFMELEKRGIIFDKKLIKK